MVNLLVMIVLFIIGAIFGSFGGVLIGRKWDKKGIESIIFGRSVCEKCGKVLSPIELIPIVSFFLQKGKCKKCGVKLPNFYRIIEALMGFVFVCTYLFFPYNSFGELLFWLALNWGFMLLIIVDYQDYELHFPMWITTTAIAIIFAVIKTGISKVLIMTCVFVALFILIYFFSKFYVKIRYKTDGEGFGQGDIYLAGTIGILFPFVFLGNNIVFNNINIIYLVLFYIIISGIAGLIYVGVRYLISKNKSKELPFIPAMIIAFWILLLVGNYFINFVS